MMIFGRIDYIDLLSLHIYLKRYPLLSGIKISFGRKKGVLSKLNLTFYKGRIDAAIISGIEGIRPKYHNLDLGTCANKRVLSVLVEKETTNQKDLNSASSNVLASTLKQKGRVVIGNRALKSHLEDKNHFIDLCELWYGRTYLPFVFTRSSCTEHKTIYKRILLSFVKNRIKIPNYVLKSYAKTRGISKKDILFYPEKVIYYKLGRKEKKVLTKFTRTVRFQDGSKT